MTWFSFTLQLVTEEPFLKPDLVHAFIAKVMEFDPQTLTDQGLCCFDSLICCVKSNDIQRLGLTGIDYLWKVIRTGQEDIAHKAITSMMNLCTKLSDHNVRRGEGRERKMLIRYNFVHTCYI